MLCAYNLRTGNERNIHLPDLIYKNQNITEILCDILGMNEILQLLYVISGIKPGARIIVAEKYYNIIYSFLSALGMFVLRSDFYVINKVIRNAGYSYRKSPVPQGEKSKIFIYLAFDKEYCAALKNYEAESNDYEFGKLLGYPTCCVKYFSRCIYSKPGDYFMNSVTQHSTFLYYPFLNNTALWAFGIGILDHFPCKQDCRQSSKLARRYTEMLKRVNHHYYEFLERELKAIVICLRNASVVYSNNYSKTRHGLVLNEIKGDGRDPLYCLIKKHGILPLTNPNKFDIGKKQFVWPEAKIIVFN